MEDAKKNLSTSLISALTNAGHCNDKVLCATVAEGAAGAEPGSGAKWYAPNFPRFLDFLPPFIWSRYLWLPPLICASFTT